MEVRVETVGKVWNVDGAPPIVALEAVQHRFASPRLRE
jgi:hypothetical protein